MIIERKNNLSEKDNKYKGSLEDELTLLHISLNAEKVKKETEGRLKDFKKRLNARKKNEAFPRKTGKYNELFQDFGKESGSRDNPIGAA